MNAKQVLDIQLETAAEICRIWDLPKSDFGHLKKYFSKSPKRLKISTTIQLKHEAEGGADFYILLKGGAKSSKYITYGCCGKNHYHVENMIDGTTQRLSEKDLFNWSKTNIGHAMTKGAFFKELY